MQRFMKMYDKATAERFLSLGPTREHVIVTGSIKFDVDISTVLFDEATIDEAIEFLRQKVKSTTHLKLMKQKKESIL